MLFLQDLLKLPWVPIILALLIVAWIISLPYCLSYRVTPKHFQISFLGIPVRWVSLANIERVTKHHLLLAEHWWCTWRPRRRRLMIRKKRGMVKNLVITPKYRYEFKMELMEAIKQASPGQSQSDATPPDSILAEEKD